MMSVTLSEGKGEEQRDVKSISDWEEKSNDLEQRFLSGLLDLALPCVRLCNPVLINTTPLPTGSPSQPVVDLTSRRLSNVKARMEIASLGSQSLT